MIWFLPLGSFVAGIVWARLAQDSSEALARFGFTVGFALGSVVTICAAAAFL